MSTTRRKATEAEAAALASGIRLRIIRLTFTEALTNKELAERLGRDPATTLHHVRKLVDTGFLAPQPARRGARGAKEIPYLSTGLSWNLDGPHGDGIGEAMLEAYLAEIAETGIDPVRQTRLVVQLDAEQSAELERRLYALLEEFKQRPVDPDADRTAIYLSLYPSP
ncbi:ArsR/SmtB family transcription factor [Amycolatopsis anabasis]|uniref:ArsR/SmtB family transcription factor n=1 Tax=Amycolatopsis anabasis TaxID=1840409 RepID=UPI00131E1B26|nr:winged helix-turn-helix domain-containing protein [Amycolatopsis anabasis]